MITKKRENFIIPFRHCKNTTRQMFDISQSFGIFAEIHNIILGSNDKPKHKSTKSILLSKLSVCAIRKTVISLHRK